MYVTYTFEIQNEMAEIVEYDVKVDFDVDACHKLTAIDHFKYSQIKILEQINQFYKLT